MKGVAQAIHAQRILIFGAGVIGSIYGGLLAQSGHKVTFLARGQRLNELRTSGLNLRRVKKGWALLCPQVEVIEHLEEEDCYDYIFVCLRAEQVRAALPLLASNRSKTYVFMVNNARGYLEWEECLGKGRILPAFPGAGGEIRDGTVCYDLTQRQIQPTVLGEIGGKRTRRLKRLREMLDGAGFSTSIREDMDAWQKTHLALVCPLACAIYHNGKDSRSLARDKKTLSLVAKALQESLSFIRASGIGISPRRFCILLHLPIWLIRSVLSRMFASKWAETFVWGHSLNARVEMEFLTGEFLSLAKGHGFELPTLQRLLEVKDGFVAGIEQEVKG